MAHCKYDMCLPMVSEPASGASARKGLRELSPKGAAGVLVAISMAGLSLSLADVGSQYMWISTTQVYTQRL